MVTSTKLPRLTRGDQVANHLYEFGGHALPMLFNTPAEHVPHVTEIAEMNLISAYGLPGTEKMDMGAMLATLEAWAQRIRHHTEQNVGKYLSGQTKFPSLARFRVTSMIYVLTRQIGIRYNPAQIGNPDPNPPPMDDAEDAFIHGMLGPRKTGTCACLPVLLVAIGRRLNYPLKLVHSLAHCFCRWDAPDERFNIEWHEGANARNRRCCSRSRRSRNSRASRCTVPHIWTL